MTYEIEKLLCSVDPDPKTREPKVVLFFEDGNDQFEFALDPREATELAALIETLASEASRTVSPRQNS
jgi:hypothetical protein